MNKEYMYVNGKVVVFDENGLKPPIDYSENIGDMLVTENIIEVIEDKKSKKEINLKKSKSIARFSKFEIPGNF